MKQITKQKLNQAMVLFSLKKPKKPNYLQLYISSFFDQKFFYVIILGKTHWPIHKHLRHLQGIGLADVGQNFKETHTSLQ